MQFDSDFQSKQNTISGSNYGNPRGQDERIRLSGFIRNICKEQTLQKYKLQLLTALRFNGHKNLVKIQCYITITAM